MISNIDSTLHRIGLLDKSQNKLNYQMGSGKVLQHGSDDSILHGRVVHVEDRMKTNEGIIKQIERVDVLNKNADKSLADTKQHLEYIKSKLILANTSTTSIEGLEAIAQEILGIKESIFKLANTSAEGQYVFAGSDASVRPFVMDPITKVVTYAGNDKLRQVAIDDGTYKKAGVNGLDSFYYTTSFALKGATLEFQENDRIVDQDGNEWHLNKPANTTLSKTNWDGSVDTLAVANMGTHFEAVIPNVDGAKFEAKKSVFDMIDEAVRGLKGLDENGNPVHPTDPVQDYNYRRAEVAKYIDQTDEAHTGVTMAHSNLGSKNQTFDIVSERLEAKKTQLKILRTEIAEADKAEIAVKLKSLEISYASVYSTVNRTFELSLINFMK